MNPAGHSSLPPRLGLNHGRYHGERIDIGSVLRATHEPAQAHGWQIDLLPGRPGVELLAFRRAVPQPARRIYISAGIHGDEPAGPLAVLELLRQNAWPPDLDLWLCPCLNPTGFPLNTRENGGGVDLNRDYKQPQSAETRAHIAWLERQPRFDLCLCLHEDWEAHGFYVYELNPDHQPSIAGRIVEAARKVCPIDHSPIIDDRAAQDGIIRPSLDPATRPLWAEAFYLYTHKTRLGYTLEAPSDFPLPARVAALVQAVQAAL